MKKFKVNLAKAGLLILSLFCASFATGQVSVLTQHNDTARTGQNLDETTLNTSNVNQNSFGKLFWRTVDGFMYAQPLYVPGLTIQGGTHNVVFVATQHNSVYAFDADNPNEPAPLWQVNLGTPVPSQDICILSGDTNPADCPYYDISPEIGITSTPVIDPVAGIIYVVNRTKNTTNTTYHDYLHALNLTTGAEELGGPVEITGQVNGTGTGSSGGVVAFQPAYQHQRPSLLLENGYLYIAFGSVGDIGSVYHGWVMSYNASTLQQEAIFNVTPNGDDGGIWSAGQGPVADSSGNIYFMTGNGDFNANVQGGTDYGDSFIKFSGSSLAVTDYFTPDTQGTLDADNEDLGSGGPMLMPSTSLLVGMGKDGIMRVVNSTNMGHYSSSTDNDVQDFTATPNAFFSSPVYWDSPNHGPVIYIWGEADYLKAFQYTGSTFNTTPVSEGTSINSSGDPNAAAISISANGSLTGTGILWATGSISQWAKGTQVPGVVRAFDATNLTDELWDSTQNLTRDDVGNSAKFNPPTITNGKVYVGSFSGQLQVYGLTPPAFQGIQFVQTNSATPQSSSTSVPVAFTNAQAAGDLNVVIVGWNDATSAVQSVTDSAGNTYTLALGPTRGTALSESIYYAKNILANNANTVTVTFNQGATKPDVRILEYSGVSTSSPLDVSTGAFGDSYIADSGYVNTNAANELIVGADMVSSNTTIMAGAPFTPRVITAPDSDVAEDRLVNVPGSYHSWAPLNSTANWIMQMVSFKSAIASTVPFVNSVTPNNGPAAGGTAVTITGIDFAAGATVLFGSTAATNVAVVNSTTITATAPAGSTGAVTVTVTNSSGQSGSLSDAFTYFAPPTVTGVSPNSGSNSGGTSVTITGTNFISGSTVTFGSAAATNVVVVSSTTITATTPASAVGAVTVTVTNSIGQSGSLASGFTYVLEPTVTGVSPNSGVAAGGTSVTITGTNFVSGATVTFGSSSATNVVVVSSTSITATTPAGTAGSATVTVTVNGESGSLANGFTYIGSPTVTSVSPNNGPMAGGTAVTIAGANFGTGATVTFGSAAATNVVVVSSTSITATTPAGAAGAVTVTVTNVGSQSGSLASGFTYNVAAAISYVQVASATPQTATASVPVSYPAAETAGDLNVVVVGWNDTTSTVQSVKDSLGNTYNLAIGPTVGTGIQQSIYYAANVTGGTDTITVTFSQAAAYPDVRILEYRGVTALDVTAGAAGNSTSASSGSATTTSGNELIFGADTIGTTTAAAGSGFTARIITTPDSDLAEDKIVTSTGSNSATATLTSSGPWVIQMATFAAVAAQPPTVTSVSPNTGSTAGGTAVTITGSNFAAGASVTFGGTAATNVTVVNATSITAATPAGTAGAVTVAVTVGGQSGSLASGFTYAAPPTVTGVSPNGGPLAGGTAVTITGTNFAAGATVTIGGAAATSVTVVSSTSITATTPAGSAGAVTITVTNSNGLSGSLASGFTFAPAPTVTSVSPNSGSTAGGTSITITGTNFAPGAVVEIVETRRQATNVVVVNSTTITAVTPTGDAGVVSVSVTANGQSGTLSDCFTYIVEPTVTSVSPSTGPTAGGTSVTITGTNFASGATVTFGSAAATNVTVVSSTSITATTPAGTAGAATVTVTVSGQSGSLASGFTYVSTPTVTGVSPNTGPTTGGTSVTITGTNFASGATVTFGSAAATNVVVVSSTSITATTPAGSAGAVTVTVTNAGSLSGSLTNGFTYVVKPTLTGVSPNTGSTAGGTSVTITGTNFASGATVTFGSAAATNVVVVSSTSITATTPAGTAGAVTVTVTLNGQSGSLANGFTYIGTPTVSSVSPNNGPTAGGTAVTITGTNFASGATVTFGSAAATSVVVVSSTSITATTPAGTAGAVTVTVTNVGSLSGSLASGFTYNASVAISYVQVASSDPQTASATVALSYPAAETAGDLNAVVVGWNDTTSTVQSVKDSLGNTYKLAIGPTVGTGIQQSIYYAANITGGTNTITVTFSQAAAFPDVRILEYRGVTALDVTAGASGSSASASSGSATTTSANELIVGADTIGTTTAAAGSGFTARIITTPDSDLAEDKTVTSAGSNSAAATLTSGPWVMQMATFAAVTGPVPTVTGVSPNSGSTAGGTAVTITGTNFASGASVTFGSAAATNVTVVSSTSITATTPAGSAGAATVTVTVGGQSGSLASGFTYVAPPTVTSVSPNSGSIAGGTAVTITGTNFASGDTVVFGSTAATNVTVVSSTSITATTPAGSAGAVTVTVTGSGGLSGSLASGYTYAVQPTVTNVSPNTGSTAGGTPVTISGTNFAAGATVTFGSTAATNVTVVNSTTITATTPAGTAGAVTVTVTNSGGLSGSLATGFTFVAPPTVTSVSPNGGPTTGGTAVTITGTNFASGATVTFGSMAATNVTVVNSTTITATTPAEAAGAVTVTVTNSGGLSGSLASGFTYAASPTVTSASPNSGSNSGGTSVTITGTNFASGATVTFGSAAATSVVVVNSTTITATTPAGAVGAVTVTVTNVGSQSGSLTNGFTYIVKPTVTSVSPNAGSTAGGTSVTITGTNFAAGATVTFGSAAATNVTVVSSTSITATTPAGTAGAVTVTVTVSGQSGSLAGGFTYVATPTVTSVSPNSGPTTGATSVTITGTNFASGATVTFGSAAATNVTVVSSTSITATTPAGTAGAVTVTVTVSGQSGSLASGFTYVVKPTVTSVSPNTGATAGGTSVTITGTNFASGATVTFGSAAATNVVVVSSTSITATTPAGTAGAVTVTVTVSGQGGSLASGFTYVATPTLTSVSPNSGPTTGGTAVTITGTNFASGATVTFGSAAATNVTVVSSTSITATTPAGTAGAVTVTVTASGQSGSLASGFTYVVKPTVTSVSPNSGPIAGGTSVTITGTNFASGATVTFGSAAATNVVVVSSTSITATTPAGTAGAATVTVTLNGQSGSLANGFTYIGTPTVTSVSPNNGPTAGGTSVTITGTNFASGATVTFSSAAATNVTVVSSTSITATTPAGAAGAVTVTVTNVGSLSGSLASGYTYNSSVAISYAQVASSDPQTASATVAVSYPAAQTAGDLNVVVVGWNDTTSTVQSVKDSLGNTYSLAVGPTVGSGMEQSIYYAANITGGTNTITVTFSKAAAYPDIRILEYRGVSSLDVTAAATGSSTSANSGSATTTSANELIFGADIVATLTGSAGSGFTSRVITSPDGDIAEDKIVTSTGSNSATATLNGAGAWIMQMVTFSAASGPQPTVTSVSPNSGSTAGGTSVTITGTNFVAGATVQFGSAAATNVTVVSGTSITATTPAGAAGAATVTVSDPAGKAGSLASGFTYVQAPTVGSVSPNSGPIAGGTSVTITGTNFASGDTVSIGGAAATNVVVASTTSITATTPAGAIGAVTVTVTNSSSLSGSLASGFTYIGQPTVTAVSPNNGSTLGQTAVTITGTNFGAGATVTFGGSAATGVTVVNSTTITATTPAGSAGAVTVTVTNVGSQSGSLASGFTYLVVNTVTAPGNVTAALMGTATPVYVSGQEYYNATAGTSFTSAAFNSTGADLLVMFLGCHNNTVFTITDSFGNTWLPLAGPAFKTGSANFPMEGEFFYAANATTGANHTITVMLSQSEPLVMSITAYSGDNIYSPIDAYSSINGDNGTISEYIASNSLTTTQPNDLLLGIVKGFSNNTYTPGAGYTKQTAATGLNFSAETQAAPSPGSYSSSFTASLGDFWQSVIGAIAPKPNESVLTWTASVGGPIANYFVERCTGIGCSSFAQIASVGGSTLTYTDTTIVAGTVYNYRVRAENSGGIFSNYSSVMTVSPIIPTVVTSFAATPLRMLSWNPSAEIGGSISQYSIERCTSVGCTSFAPMATTTATSYTDSSAAAGTTYNYRVRALDANGFYGPYSVVATATIPAYFDNAADGGNNGGSTLSLTYPYTVGTSANRLLLVNLVGDTSADDISSVTYGGAAMALVKKIQTPSSRWHYLYSLLSPASGTSNVVITAGSAHYLISEASSWYNVAQSGQPVGLSTNTASTGVTLTTTLPANPNTAIVMESMWAPQGIFAGTGSSELLTDSALQSLGFFTTASSPVTESYPASIMNTSGGQSQASSIMASYALASGGTSGITFDNAADGGNNGGSTTSLTYSYTVGTGANRLLVVNLIGDTSADDISSVTYGGVLMTLLAKTQAPSNNRQYLYYLLNPTSGANNIVITAGSAHYLISEASSWYNVSQSGQPDAFVTSTLAAGNASQSTSLTTVSSGALVIQGLWSYGHLAAGVGAIPIITDAALDGAGIFASSASPVSPAGNVTMSTISDGSQSDSVIMASFAPVP